MTDTNEISLPQSGSDHRVLVVEDNGTNRMVLQHKLGKQSYDVVCAENGQAALRLLTDVDFDVVLMDVSMPVMDGLEATRRIREAKARNAQIPIIGFSAHNHSEVREKCIDAGMNDFICKPATDEVMLEKLRNALSAN